jgi:ATP-binding cassette subfamily B protein
MQNPYFFLVKTAWKYSKKDRKKYALTYSLFILSDATFALYPVLWGWFIDEIQKNPSKTLHITWLYALVYLLLKILELVFQGPAHVNEQKLSFNLTQNFLDELYHHALHLPLRWHQDHHSGATTATIRKAYYALKTFSDDGFMYIRSISRFLLSMVAMIYFSPLFGGIGFLLGVVTVIIIIKFDKPYINYLTELDTLDNQAAIVMADSLSNIFTVTTLRLQKSMELGLKKKINNIWMPMRRNVILNEWKWFTAFFMIGLIYVLITLGYIYQNWKPGTVFYIGGLVALLGFVNEFTSVFHDISWQYTLLIRHSTTIRLAEKISTDFKEHFVNTDEKNDHKDWSKAEIKNLNFSYKKKYNHEHLPQSLHNISLSMERGKRISIIGESGSGKSTLLALLRGLYEPESEIFISIDGQPANIREINESVTLFPQEPEIFRDTLEYNITMGLPFSDEAITEVCEKAKLTNVIRQLPNGLSSHIDEKGVNLSGGQKQRLALARGILAAHKSKIVLMDEPTSSVDPKTEMLIYENLFETFVDKVFISAMHRLHFLEKFDYIYVLEKGKIVGEGTFDFLLQNNALFQELWEHQKSKID